MLKYGSLVDVLRQNACIIILLQKGDKMTMMIIYLVSFIFRIALQNYNVLVSIFKRLTVL